MQAHIPLSRNAPIGTCTPVGSERRRDTSHLLLVGVGRKRDDLEVRVNRPSRCRVAVVARHEVHMRHRFPSSWKFILVGA